MALIDANTYPTAGILTSTLMSTYDVLKPQHAAELFSRFGDQYMPMFQWLRAMGREEPIGGDEWYAHEENRYHRTITVRAEVANPGADTTGTYTLKATDLDSSYRFYPRLGDIVTIPGSEVQGIITAVDVSSPSAPTIDISPLYAGDTLGLIAADTELAITSGAFAAGTGQPTGTTVGTSKRTFNAQIFKESVGIEGTALVNEKWYKVMDNGKDLKGWYSPGYMRAEYLIGLKMDGAFMFGKPATSTNGDLTVASGNGIGNKVKTTKGIVPWIRDLGKVQSITAGSFDVLDLDEASLYIRTQGITSGVALWLVGARLANDVENSMKTYLQYTGVDYTKVEEMLFPGNREMSAAFGFRSIQKGGMTFVMKVMDQWSNPTTFGATGYDMDQYGIIIPLTQYKDPKTGVKMQNFATKYRALDGYNRRFETWRVAGAGGGLYVTDVDREDTYIRTHVGLQVVKANQMVLQDPT